MNGRRVDRYTAWGLTWIAYGSYYLGRKGFSVVKSTLRQSLGVSERALGLIDTFYLAAYALGLFCSGYVGDRVGARRLIAAGLALSALCCAAFGATSAAVWFGVLFFINGLAQSTGWPGTTRAMAEWTTPRNRGTVMAFWATCYQVGSIVASDFSAYLLRRDGWRAAFLGPAACMLVVAVLIFLFLKRGDRAYDGTEPALSVPAEPDADVRRSAQRRALQNPVLWAFGASYFFIKYVRYSLLFWLPYYLNGTLGYTVDRAAYVSNAFEAGGIVGVIAIGMLSDRVRRWSRASLSMLSLLGLACALFACAALPQHDVWLTVGALALVGALLFGPDALLSGAAAQDVGGAAAAATATGLVNGVGSLGGMLEGLTLPEISRHFGWQAMFPLLAGLAVCAALALIPAARRPDVRGTDL